MLSIKVDLFKEVTCDKMNFTYHFINVVTMNLTQKTTLTNQKK